MVQWEEQFDRATVNYWRAINIDLCSGQSDGGQVIGVDVEGRETHANTHKMASQRFCLRWNNHQTNMLSVFDQLLHAETFTDVTLAVDGQYLKAHKVSFWSKDVGAGFSLGFHNAGCCILTSIHPKDRPDVCAQLTTSLIKPGESSK